MPLSATMAMTLAQSLLVVFLAIAAGSVVKGATGLGLPVFAMPVLVYLYGVPHAVAILAIPIFATNASQLWTCRHHRREADYLVPMLVCGVVGLGIGTWLITITPKDALLLCLGLLLSGYIALRIFKPAFHIERRAGFRLAFPVGLLTGTMQGAIGLCAAVAVPFIHSLSVNREAMLFSLSALFLLFAILQTALLWFLDLIEPRHLGEGLFALVPAVIFLPVGAWLGRLMRQDVFERVFLAILGAIAFGLIQSGVRSLL